MIIDKIQLAGPDAYFKKNGGSVNLAEQVTSRTEPLRTGNQVEVSAIELLIESDDDLRGLFNFQPNALISISVMKEMFPRLFADPFRHRVHNIAGFDDFKRGTLENGKVMDVDGIPTIVSIGTGQCVWKSRIYPMPAPRPPEGPEPIALKHASWELAASTKTSPGNFSYTLAINTFDNTQRPIQTVYLTNPVDRTQPGSLDPSQPRKLENLNLTDISSYQVEFTADVKKDAALYEKHTTLVGESIGTPLLRAVNFLEPVASIYDIHSLQELLSLSSEYHLFEFQAGRIKKILATLNLSATLVHSEYEIINIDDPTDPGNIHEFIEIAVKSDKFSKLEAKLSGEVLERPVLG